MAAIATAKAKLPALGVPSAVASRRYSSSERILSRLRSGYFLTNRQELTPSGTSPGPRPQPASGRGRRASGWPELVRRASRDEGPRLSPCRYRRRGICRAGGGEEMTDDPKSLVEAGKAIQEVSKATGKAIDLAETFGGFISRFVAGPLEQGVGIFEDKLRYLRWERQVRLMDRAEQLMSSLGKSAPTKPIPLKLAIPLFQAASLEDDDYMQDMWAKLLVNASISERRVELRRAHIDILERLSPFEALIFKKIYEFPVGGSGKVEIVTGDLPHSVSWERDSQQEAVQPNDDVMMALANLARLGCITLPTAWGGGEIFTTVYPTIIGQNLISACKLGEES